jgi:hypothetical protein
VQSVLEIPLICTNWATAYVQQIVRLACNKAAAKEEPVTQSNPGR